MDSIVVEGLCKTYPTFFLDNISFTLKEGYIMGFIGRNGAGKTTTLKSMLNFVHPDSGRTVINGFDINTNEHELKSSIGFVSGTDCFYEQKKLSQIIKVTKKFFPEWNDSLCSELMQKFNLDGNKLVKNLSAGMKVKFQIALAMSHNARLLILDEPTSGLDPVSRDELIQLFQDYISDGKHSILFSTHIISDLEKCADFITYIKKGRVFSSSDVITFKESWLQVNGKKDDVTEDLKSKIIGLRIHNFGAEGIIHSDDRALFKSFEISKPSMEEIMVHIERD